MKKEKILHSGNGINKPKTLQQRSYLMVEPKGLLQVVNETRMPMTVTVFTQPILSFLASVLRPREKKKKHTSRTKTCSMYTKKSKDLQIKNC